MCLLSGGGFGPVVEVDYEAAGAVCLGGELLEVCAYEGCCFGCGVGEAEGDVGVHPDCDARFGVGTLGQGEGEVLAAAELGRGDDLDVVQEAIVDDGVAVAVVKVSHGPYQSDGGRAQGVTGLSHETAVPLTYRRARQGLLRHKNVRTPGGGCSSDGDARDLHRDACGFVGVCGSQMISDVAGNSGGGAAVGGDSGRYGRSLVRGA